MNCPQCNAELADSATFCPRCGTSLPGRTASFSYLPPGAPPWPRTPSQPYGAGPGIMNSQPLQEVGTTYSTATPTIRRAPTIHREAKAKRSVGSVLLIIGLLLLSIVVGVGGTLAVLAANGQLTTAIQSQLPTRPNQQPASAPTTPATSSTPQATAPATGSQLPTPTSFLKVTIAQMGISLKYPGDWTEDQPSTGSNGNTSVNFHPQQQLPVDMAIGRLSASNSATVTNTSEVNQANIQGFGTSQNLQGLQLLTTTPQHVTIGGISWDEQDATFTLDSNGNLLHVVSISVKHKSYYFNILYFAPSAVYDEAMQKYYAQMLSSFQFTA